MKRLKRLLREIHQRFLWQAVAIYLVFARIAFAVARTLIEHRSLPSSFRIISVALLVIGLPVIMITAYVQHGIPKLGRSDPTLHVDVDEEGEGDDVTVRRRATGVRRVFTWRNAILGGFAAFTLWALVAAAWLLLANELVDRVRDPGAEEAVESEGT